MATTHEIITYENTFLANPKGLCVNAGCGERTYKGWQNTDKYTTGVDIVRMPMEQLGWEDGTIDKIFSAHSLEHLYWRDAYMCLKHWYTKLRPGGELMLSLPDLKQICAQIYMDDPDKHSLGTYKWLLAVLYGYQARPGAGLGEASYDPGQLHTAGFTPARMKEALTSCGYEILCSMYYDGFGTPSQLHHCRKPLRT